MNSKEVYLHATGVVPIRRARLVDEASRIIRDVILAGKLAAGARLRQAELANQLGISRTPLREALMKLEQEGLVEMLPKNGLRVIRIKLEEAIELYEIREVLDGLAASLAGQRTNERTLKSLEGHLKKMEKCLETGNAHEWYIHHVAFHEGIFRVSGNRRLLKLISNVQLSIQRFHPLLLTTPNRLRNAYREHMAIFTAIKSRNPGKAERLARLHITNASGIVANFMAKRGAENQAQTL